MGALLSLIGKTAGEQLRPKQYVDREKSPARGCVMLLGLIVMVLSVVGIFVYRFAKPGTQQYRIEDLTPEKTHPLFEKDYEGEYQALSCNCKSPAKIRDAGYDMSLYFDEMVRGCQQAVGNDSLFVGLCYTMLFDFQENWNRERIDEGELYSVEDFQDSVSYSFLDDCYAAYDRSYAFSVNIFIYFQNQGLNVSDLADGDTPLGRFYNITDKWTDMACNSSLYFNDSLSFYNNYFETCNPNDCTYIADEPYLSSALWALGVCGTAWTIILLIAGKFYESVYLNTCGKREKLDNADIGTHLSMKNQP